MENQTEKRVCVTGTTGYIGSWLVRSLLLNGYYVHATARDPRKAERILSSLEGNNRLRIFQADLNKEGSFDEALEGCTGLFHVAASMEFHISVRENIEEYVKREILDPAVKGTVNLLKSCIKNSVKRVIFTSSVSTLTAKDENGNWRKTVDESSVTPMATVWESKSSGWVYVLSKLLTEQEAFKFAKENKIELISIIPPTVAGPFLTPTVPSSLQVLLSPITGDSKFYPILMSVHSRIGSISLVHIDDICGAHIFLFERTGTNGRYLCCAGNYTWPQLASFFTMEFKNLDSKRFEKEFDAIPPAIVSSKRLIDLGFKFKFDVKDIVKQSVASCIDNGFLSK
ncbi:hypothetical protein LUZ60_017419 [Juncus effusus]|nr:hypothetical protein LUZ60_017419 [Juncus effusus]